MSNPKKRDHSNDNKSGKSKKSKSSKIVSDWYEKDKHEMFVGAHVSIVGGLYKSIIEAHSVGAQSFGLFLTNQRRWDVKPLASKDAQLFRDTLDEYGFPSHLIVPHGSYLLNCGAPNEQTLDKSRKNLLDGMSRCDKLGIDLFNFHPGSTCGKISRKDSISRIAESINYCHSNTNNVIAVLENMSKQGNSIGGDFKELKSIIDEVKDRSRVGVCLDTCHAFAAGYDITNKKGYEKMMHDFDTIIGFKYLKALHINDSKGKCDDHLDRHESIGKGKIGMNGFEFVMNEKRFKDLPMILETPDTSLYAQEIKMLKELIV